MTAICFVCNLPILSHQVGLVWQGGNGWDDLVREQVEESTLRQRLGAGRRDSAAQITSISPPTETQETSPPHSGMHYHRYLCFCLLLIPFLDILTYLNNSLHAHEPISNTQHPSKLSPRPFSANHEEATNTIRYSIAIDQSGNLALHCDGYVLNNIDLSI
ncbi:hypothetical protein C0J52_22677 [Blattella germanica]|nr:hypothetical protein C0J52_22677 [Blattella germanica]